MVIGGAPIGSFPIGASPEKPPEQVGGYLTFGGDRLTIGGKPLWIGPRPPGFQEIQKYRAEVEVFDSAAWTGVEIRMTSAPEVLDQLEKTFCQMDNLVESTGLTNSEKQKAKAITSALRSLISSPEPEWKAIVMLLASPALSAALALFELIKLAFELILGK